MFINGNPVSNYTVSFDNNTMQLIITFDREYTDTTNDELSIVYTKKGMLDLGAILPLIQSTVEDISLAGWKFSADGTSFIDITLPHSINAGALSNTYTRGEFTYKITLNLYKNRHYYLVLGSADQSSIVKINGTVISTISYGYNTICVDLGTVVTGSNIIEVLTNNTKRVNIQPYVADFNNNNGLTRKAYLYTSGRTYFDTIEYGSQKCHICAHGDGKLDVVTKIQHKYNQSEVVKVVVKLLDGDTVLKVSETEHTLLANSNDTHNESLVLDSFDKWDGRNNAKLYTVQLQIIQEEIVLDSISVKTGFRSFAVTKQANDSTTRAFTLNGNEYALYGVNYHTDKANKASALTDVDYESDWEIVEDLKPTMIKFAHYPCDHILLDKCDEAGVIVSLQIPFCRNFPADASNDFKQNIIDSMKAMVREYYNHPCIVFWDMSNEVGMDAVLGYDDAAYHTFIKQLADDTKLQDPNRLVGYSINEGIVFGTDQSNWTDVGDFICSSCYRGWYSGLISTFTSTMNSVNTKLAKPVGNNEHGFGASINKHIAFNQCAADNYGGTSGPHYEEYQAWCFEKLFVQLKSIKYLIFDLVWAMFDFAVSARNEGTTPYQNDKGLVTRDRSVKKDAYYLHKAYWNTSPMVHITSKRWTVRQGVTALEEHVYSNCAYLKVYHNNSHIEDLANPDAQLGIIWNTSSLELVDGDNTIRIDGYNSDNELVATDTHVYNYDESSSIVIPVNNWVEELSATHTEDMSAYVEGLTYTMGVDGTVTINGTALANNPSRLITMFFAPNNVSSPGSVFCGWDDTEAGTYTTSLEYISGEVSNQTVAIQAVPYTMQDTQCTALAASIDYPAQLTSPSLYIDNLILLLKYSKDDVFTNYKIKPHLYKEGNTIYTTGNMLESIVAQKGTQYISSSNGTKLYRSHTGLFVCRYNTSSNFFNRLTHGTIAGATTNTLIADTEHTIFEANKTYKLSITVYKRELVLGTATECKFGARTKTTNADFAGAAINLLTVEIGVPTEVTFTPDSDLSCIYTYCKGMAVGESYLCFNFSAEEIQTN